MLIKLLYSAVIGGTIFGMASFAGAETNVNIYGASAQYKFWTAAADDFLADGNCSGTIYEASDDDKHGITWCDGADDGVHNGTDDIYIRYSSKASFDGIRSVQGIDPDGVAAADGCAANERLMADETLVTFGPRDSLTGIDAATDLSCKDVTIGASDVAAATFNQLSTGDVFGPKDSTDNVEISRNITNITIPGTYDVYRPVVVPFAFFRNAKDFGGSNGIIFDNMSRLMATSIFSGNATNWQQFDPAQPSLPIVVCFRHAGSGTHATLDAAVMRGDYNLVQTQVANRFYFNDGSSDLMRCVGGPTSKSGYESWEGYGAVGYADADKVKMTTDLGDGQGLIYNDPTDKGTVKLMTWQGAEAVKNNIINGQYDFWSAQWLYARPDEDTATDTLIQALAAFASDSTNLALTGKEDYWAAQSEMNVDKANDFTYPSFK